MPTFPSSPVDGSEADGGRYTYYDPPRVWRLTATSSPSTDRNALDIAEIRQQLETKVDVAYLDDLSLGANSEQVQVVSLVAGENIISLSAGRHIHAAGTAGDGTIRLVDVPSGAVTVILSIDVTTSNDEITVQDAVFYGTAPVEADWDAQDQMVFRLTKTPFVDSWVQEWLLDQQGPPSEPTVTPPTLTAQYSTSASRTGLTTLEAATLPAGEVAIVFGPESSDIQSMRYFCNHVGALPAIGSEGDSYVGNDLSSPWDFLGGTGSTAVLWDTAVDPTGNDRTGYNPNGSTTITVEATLIDGQTVEQTFTFNTANAPLSGGDPTRTRTMLAYNGGGSSALVTVPDGVDRAVLVKAWYGNGAGTVLTGLTLGGQAMTKITAATRDITGSTGVGVFTAYLTETDLSTGTLSLVPTYAASIGAYSSVIYQIEVLTNVASPVFGGAVLFSNTNVASLAPSIAGVPANSMLFTGSLQEDPTSAEMTVDLGTYDGTATELSVNPKFEVRTAYLADSGASATETATWVATGRQLSTLVYLDYATSSGGSGTTPVVPGTPTVALTTPADNQFRATWSPTTDAVLYQIRWSQGASPTVPNGVPIEATSPITVTGLAASQSYAVQVRARSATDTWGDWSTTQYITTTGSVPPPPSFSGKFLAADNPFDVSYVEGSNYQGSDMWVHSVIRRRNPLSTEQAQANMANDVYVDEAISKWENRGGASSSNAYIAAAGPRYVWSMKLAPLSLGNHNGRFTPTQAASQVLDMGKTGSTGTVNRDWVYEQLAAKLNRTYRGYRVDQIMHISVAHESNGPWNTEAYMGRDPNIIGDPRLTGAKNAEYGAEMAAALRQAGATGECAAVHRLAVEHVMEVIWSIAPNAILGMTPAADGESVPLGEPVTANSDDWVYDAFPRNEGIYNYKLDFLYPTMYARSPGAMKFLGGDATNPANWTRRDGWLELADPYVERYGCAFGLLEGGVAFAVPGLQWVANDVSMPSDNANYAFFEIMFNQLLTTANYPAGFGVVNHWSKMRWQLLNPSGGSYNMLEGLWGAYPSSVFPSSTAKPTGAVGDGSWYPRTRAWFQTNYPR